MKRKAKNLEDGKTKKITIKFFLNKTVQPRTIDNRKAYPLYMLITYNRRNTMLKCYYGTYYRDIKEAIKGVQETQPGLLEFEEKIIRKTIEYEIDNAEGEFSLKGIYKKYNHYCRAVHMVMENHLKHQLYRIANRTRPFEFAQALDFTNQRVSIDTLYTMVKRIYRDLKKESFKSLDEQIEIYHTFLKLYNAPFFDYNFPTVVEWIDQSAREDYKSRLEEVYKRNKEKVDSSLSLIDKVVQATLA
jgi:hypothetical protein